jgi:hypothetical protein
MKTILLFAFLSVTANILAEKPASSRSPSERDYAVMTATPFKAEVALGEKRLDKFLHHLDARRRALLDQTPNVAIQVRALTAGDISWLTNRLYHGSAHSLDYYHDLDDARSVPVEYLLIFDSRTRKMVNEDGVLIMIPLLGTVSPFSARSTPSTPAQSQGGRARQGETRLL